MSSRRKPTSVLLHEKERLQDAVFIACREGHIHDLKKLKPKLNAATEAYNKRIEEDKAEAMRKEQIQQEREAAREAKRLEKERKAEERRLKKLEREAKRG
jgi:hypothetical protein